MICERCGKVHFTGGYNKKEYERYLKTECWREVRLEAFREFGWKCECCEDNCVPLEAHHEDYSLLSTWNEINSLTILCRTCHKTRHEDIEDERYRQAIDTYGKKTIGPHWKHWYSFEEVERKFKKWVRRKSQLSSRRSIR